ncbi:MAG: efflux RND transporter permease subunit, partial [Pseudomonadota bacterium]
MPPAAARPSARYRSVVVVLLLAFILLGVYAMGRLPIDLPPSRDVPRLNVRVAAPGLIALVLEEQLTPRLERALAGVPGVAAMDSVTTAGEVGIELSLHHRRDMERVQRAVAARLEQAAASWPFTVEAPAQAWTDGASQVAEIVLTSGTRDALALRDWAEAEFAKRLRELPGVAAVDIEGGAVREILVQPDQRRLAGYGLSFDDLLQAIRRNPEADPQARTAPVKGKGRSRREAVYSGNLAAVAALPVTLPDGTRIQLAEVAGLTLSQTPSPAAFRVDGAEAVRVTVARQPRAALSEVAEEVRSHVDWMRANRLIPEGIKIHSFVSQFDTARAPLRQMGYAFLAGFALILAATHLLWGSSRRTLMLGVIVVAALQGIFIAMAVSGAGLDVMTLGMLVLGTGLFGGAVMLLFESMTRPEPVQRANPAIAAAVSVALALAPVWFAGGELGTMYREPVLIFGGTWLLAALLAAWLVPMFDTRRRPAHTPWHAAAGHAMSGLRRSYDRWLRRLPQRAMPVLGVATLVLAALTSAIVVKSRALPAPVDLPGGEIVLRLQGPDSAELTALADDNVRRLGSLPG